MSGVAQARVPPAARKRINAVVADVADEAGDDAADRVRDALRSDEMYCWLVEAAQRADTYRHERWSELQGTDRLRSYDDTRAKLGAAELHLDTAQRLREDQLVSAALAGEVEGE